MVSEHGCSEFFLTYEGIHEVCPLCGVKDHVLSLCPRKPVACLDFVVAKLEASSLDPPSPSNLDANWLFVKPQRRGKPRVQSFRGSFRGRRPYRRFPATPRLTPQGIAQIDDTNFPQLPLPPPASLLPIPNAFNSLSEFQISGDNGIQLNPPATTLSLAQVDTSTIPASSDDDDDLDDDFIKALGVIHQAPLVGFDADMTKILSSCCSPNTEDSSGKNSLKHRRKEDSDGPPSP